MFNKFLTNCILIISVVLLLINFYNLYFPTDYRNDQDLVNGYFSKENSKILKFISKNNRKEILNYKDAIKQFDELYLLHGETYNFLKEASKIYFISKAPSSYSWKEKYSKVKFQENWIIYFFRIFEEFQLKLGKKSIFNGAYIFYHSSDYKFALKRGISLCSQDAISFADLIKKRYDIDYNILGLGGHVVMEAKINDRYYLSDPNMGLTFEFNIEEYYNDSKNQLTLRHAYKTIGRSDLINSFDRQGNRKFNYTGPKAIDNAYNPDTITLYSNFIKWLLPLFFLLIGIYLKFKKFKIRFY